MTGRAALKRLVVVADDFGRSRSVNEAIAAAHDRGIVTAASLMAAGDAFPEAAAAARSRPRLSVGLHAALCDGRGVLPVSRIPGLADPSGRLEGSPARAGLRYWRGRRRLLPQIEDELEAQFDRLEEAGIRAAHVDGHHHLHVHPLVFEVLCRQAAARAVRWIRIPEGSLSTGRLLEWGIFGILGHLNRRTASRHGLMTARRVYGLPRTGRVDEAYLLHLLPRLGEGWNELFVHPDLGTSGGNRELEALTSLRVRDRLDEIGVTLSGYGDAEDGPGRAPAGEGG